MQKIKIFLSFLLLGLFAGSSALFAAGQVTGGNQLNTGGGLQATPTNRGGGSSGSGSSSNVGFKTQPGTGQAATTSDVTTSSNFVLPPYLSHLRDRLSGHDVSDIEVIGTLTPQNLVSGAKHHVSLLTSALSFITLTPAPLQHSPVDTTCISIPPGWASNRVKIRLRNNYTGDGRSSFYLLEVLLTNKCTTGGNRLQLERRDNTGAPSAIDDGVWLTQVGAQHYLFSRPLQLDQYTAAGSDLNRLTFHLINRPEKDKLASYGYVHTRLYRIYTGNSSNGDNSIAVDKDTITDAGSGPGVMQGGQTTPVGSDSGGNTGLTQGGQTTPGGAGSGNNTGLAQGGQTTPGGAGSGNDTGLTQGGQATPAGGGSGNNTGLAQGGQTSGGREGRAVRGGVSFAKITGIAGRSKDPKHKGWHDVQRWSMEFKSGKLVMVKKQDRATSMIKRWFKGKSHVSRIILQTREGGRRYEVKGFRLTGYQASSAGGDKLETLTFSKIQSGR